MTAAKYSSERGLSSVSLWRTSSVQRPGVAQFRQHLRENLRGSRDWRSGGGVISCSTNRVQEHDDDDDLTLVHLCYWSVVRLPDAALRHLHCTD